MRNLIITMTLMGLTGLATPALSKTTDTVMLQTLQADVAQKGGMTGKGVTIGVISDGPDGYLAAEASGDLPVIQFPPAYDPDSPIAKGYSEGVAMMELVHQIAPDAQIVFCGVHGDNSDFWSIGGCAKALYQAFQPAIIVDDLPANGATFAPSSDTYLIDTLIVSHPDLIFIHSAGNGQGYNFAGRFYPTNLTIAGTTYDVENYGAVRGGTSTPYLKIKLDPGKTISALLNWNDSYVIASPPPTNNNMMGLWLLSDSGDVLAHSESNAPGYIINTVNYKNAGTAVQDVNIVVGVEKCNNHDGCNSDTLAILLTLNYELDDQQSPTLQPGMALGSSSYIWVIGAYKNPAAGFEGSMMEPYSNIGPYLNYWSPTPDTNSASAYWDQPLDYIRLPSVEIINHPDFVGVDDDLIAPIDTVNWKGVKAFTGTSAAAPTVAASVALLLSAGYTKDQIRAALEQTSLPVPAYGDTTTSQFKDTWAPADGYGLVQVWDAAKYLGYTVPTPAITSPSGTYVDIQPGDSVTFSGSCTDDGTPNKSYTWDFGDGTTSSDESPGAHTYAKAGNYNVTFNCAGTDGHSNPKPVTFAVVVQVPQSTNTGTSTSGGGGRRRIRPARLSPARTLGLIQ